VSQSSPEPNSQRRDLNPWLHECQGAAWTSRPLFADSCHTHVRQIRSGSDTERWGGGGGGGGGGLYGLPSWNCRTLLILPEVCERHCAYVQSRPLELRARSMQWRYRQIIRCLQINCCPRICVSSNIELSTKQMNTLRHKISYIMFTVLVFRPDHSQHKAQWIWSSPLTEKAVECGWLHLASHGATVTTAPLFLSAVVAGNLEIWKLCLLLKFS
jgi:hypothetical protein